MTGVTLTTLAAAALLGAVALPAAGQDPPVKGTYRANGKDAKLTHIVAVKHEPFSGKEAVTLVFTEKDPKGEKSPEITVSFGSLGSALIVGVTRDGGVFSCEVAHTALEHMGASSLGKLKTDGLTFSDGTVRGRLTTSGPVPLFDETWEVDLTFNAKLP